MTLGEYEVLQLWRSTAGHPEPERVLRFYDRLQGVGAAPRPDAVKDGTSIDALNLPTGPYNCLRRAGVRFVEQIQQMTEWQLLSMRGVGKGYLRIIQDAIKEHLK